jgi:adhesin/invasin
MSRPSRLSLLAAGVAAAAVFGLAACDKVPLLAPTGTVINLTLASEIAALNSDVEVIAVLIENGGTSSGTGTNSTTTAAGTPVQNGTLVSFTTTIGSIEPAEARTNNGRVTVKLHTGGTSGKATITAYSGGAKSTTQLTIGAAAVDHILTTASPASLSSAGGQTTVSARVEDADGNGISGVAVQFTTNKGTLSAASANTNSSGVATTVLTTNAAATVTATVGAKTSQVTVNVATAASLTVSGPASAVSVSSPATFTINAGSTVPLKNITITYGDGDSQNLGSFSSSQNATHYYASPGIKTVTVAGTDPDGVAVQSSTQIAITNLTVTVSVAPSTASGARDSTVFTFTATVAPNTASIDSYTWEFDDSVTDTTNGGSITHVYRSTGPTATGEGTKTVTVTVRPTFGNTYKAIVQVVVS